MNYENIISQSSRKTVYRDGDRRIKVFKEGFTKADILNEALNQARVEDTGLNVPKILEVTTIEGNWAIIAEFIEGKTLSQLMSENPGGKKSYLEELVDVQLDMHGRKCPMLTSLKDKMRNKISRAELDAPTRYELQTRLESMPDHDKVCHGDFNPSNVIISTGGKPYIIDWSHATQGNASSDAAITYLWFCLSGDKTGAEKYLDLFCSKSHTDRQYVQKWMPVVAAAQSVSGDEKDREILLSWADVVDYT